jgi:CheY-like chemotaxis protein
MKLGDRPILLVEDDENDVFFMKRALADAGISNALHVASDGQQVIDYLSGAGEFSDRSKHPLPSLVFLDLKLPRKNGHDVLAWMRAQEALEGVIVLVLTTSAEERDIRQAYKLGANAFLVKPPTPAQLTELLKTVKAFWMEQNEFLPAAPERHQ